jgi:hypothetical protein
MTAWLFALSGVAVGMGQAALLARAAHSRPHALSALIRFALVGAVLFLAARFGQLAFGAAGWFAGFVLAGMLVYWRLQ